MRDGPPAVWVAGLLTSVVLGGSPACRYDDVVAELQPGGSVTPLDSGVVPPLECEQVLETSVELATIFGQTALCVCTDLTASSQAVANGEVIIGTDLATTGVLRAQSLAVNRSARPSGDVFVTGDAQIGGGGWQGDGTVQVDGDLAVNGGIRARELVVGGVLTQPSGAQLNVSGRLDAPNRVEAEVAVNLNCPCQDATRELQDRLAVETVAAPTADVWQPRCGNYAFDDLVRTSLVIELEGPTELAVPGSVNIDRLEIRGEHPFRLVVSGELRIETLIAESAEIWWDGAGTVDAAPWMSMAAPFFAPRAELIIANEAQLGTAWVERVAASAPFSLERPR